MGEGGERDHWRERWGENGRCGRDGDGQNTGGGKPSEGKRGPGEESGGRGGVVSQRQGSVQENRKTGGGGAEEYCI